METFPSRIFKFLNLYGDYPDRRVFDIAYRVAELEHAGVELNKAYEMAEKEAGYNIDLTTDLPI